MLLSAGLRPAWTGGLAGLASELPPVCQPGAHKTMAFLPQHHTAGSAWPRCPFKPVRTPLQFFSSELKSGWGWAPRTRVPGTLCEALSALTRPQQGQGPNSLSQRQGDSRFITRRLWSRVLAGHCVWVPASHTPRLALPSWADIMDTGEGIWCVGTFLVQSMSLCKCIFLSKHRLPQGLEKIGTWWPQVFMT